MNKNFFSIASRLDVVMTVLDVSANRLSPACGISNSMISRWQRGESPFTPHKDKLEALAAALLTYEKNEILDPILAPYRTDGETKLASLCAYLTSEEVPALPARAEPPEIQFSGSYLAQQQVFLGIDGFRKGALMMLDYVQNLPPGQQITICAHDFYELMFHDVQFALDFIHKLTEAVKRGTTLLMISRRGYGIENDAYYARYWIVAHLMGILRNLYYDVEPPKELYVASIRGYWSMEVIPDLTAKDELVMTMYTDPRNIRRAEAHCEAYAKISKPASQYGFFKHPTVRTFNAPSWEPGPLPKWDEKAKRPDGSFSAICRVPSIGFMTKKEFSRLQGNEKPPLLPDYLFGESSNLPEGSYRIILCRDDMQEGLMKERRQNEPLTALLHRRAFVTRQMLTAQIVRLLDLMGQNENFEVALIPKSAFDKLELELVCWKNSVSVGWLQDASESIFVNDPVSTGSFHTAVNHVWDRLHKSWKRRPMVMRTLRKWLNGKELDVNWPESATVRNWDDLPKE